MVFPAGFTTGGGGGGGAFDVPLDSYTALGAAASGTSTGINTQAITAMPDGVAPFTHAWSIVTPDVAWSILSPTSATTQFRASPVPAGDTLTASFIDTVTDANGAIAASDPCDASVTNYGDPGGFVP